MKKVTGFSLIELMVVIAIVAILAAVAVPAYKTYVTKAKLSAAMTVVNDYVKKSTQYYTVNNVFANAQDIGMPLVGADPHIGNGGADSSILTNITMTDAGSGHACPSGSVLAEINTSQLGDPSITAVYIYNYIFEINGIIRPYCLYAYVIDNVSNGSELLIDNCVNMYSQPAEAAQIQSIIDSCA